MNLKLFSFVFVILFFGGLVWGLGASISCPDKLSFEEEGECVVDVWDLEDVYYDLKIYIVGDSGGISRIWDGSDWRRADWYLNEEIEDEGEHIAKIRIHKEFDGTAEGQFKLLDAAGRSVVNQGFDRESEGSVVDEEDNDENEEDASPTNTSTNADAPQENPESGSNDEEEEDEEILSNRKASSHLGDDGLVVDDVDKKIILLNDVSDVSQNVINLGKQKVIREKIIFTSKNELVKSYMIYGFVLFLILVIFLLLYEKNGYNNNYY